MHINQLVDILRFIESSIEKGNIPGQYRSIHALCCEKNLNISDELQQQLFDYKKNLSGALIETNPKLWTDAQYRIFVKFEKTDLLGEEAVIKLHDIFDRNTNNLQAMKGEIEAVIGSFSQLKQGINQLISGLEPLVRPKSGSVGGDIELEERHHLLYIQFEEAIFIKNIGQLEKFCRIWNRILASFAYLTQESVEDIRIHDIESSSITFYTGIKTINAITRGTYQVLKGYKKVLEVRRLQLELDNLTLSNKEEIRGLLEEEVLNIVDMISGSVTNELLNKYGWADTFEKDDIYKAIQVSLKQAINFVEKGGKIDSNHAGDLRQINEKVISILKNITEMESNKFEAETNSLDTLAEVGNRD